MDGLSLGKYLHDYLHERIDVCKGECTLPPCGFQVPILCLYLQWSDPSLNYRLFIHKIGTMPLFAK